MALILFEVNDTDKTVKYITGVDCKSTIEHLPVYQMVALHDGAGKLGILGSSVDVHTNISKITFAITDLTSGELQKSEYEADYDACQTSAMVESLKKDPNFWGLFI